jgi:hypothetical protein
MKSFSINWKTTALGLGTLLSVGLNSYGHGVFPGPNDLAAIMAGIGLIFAKDGNVTGGTTRQ